MKKSKTMMTMAASIAIAASMGTGVAASAGAATHTASASVASHPQNIAPIGWHMTKPMATKAQAQKALDAYAPTITAAGDWITDSDVVLVKGGWEGETYYAGEKLLKGDTSATKGKDLPQLFGYHQVTGFKTLSDANGHLKWALNELAKHPNDKQLKAGIATTSDSSKGAKTYGYVVSYYTSGTPLFKGDPVQPYVEHDNHAGDNDD